MQCTGVEWLPDEGMHAPPQDNVLIGGTGYSLGGRVLTAALTAGSHKVAVLYIEYGG